MQDVSIWYKDSCAYLRGWKWRQNDRMSAFIASFITPSHRAALPTLLLCCNTLPTIGAGDNACIDLIGLLKLATVLYLIYKAQYTMAHPVDIDQGLSAPYVALKQVKVGEFGIGCVSLTGSEMINIKWKVCQRCLYTTCKQNRQNLFVFSLMATGIMIVLSQKQK